MFNFKYLVTGSFAIFLWSSNSSAQVLSINTSQVVGPVVEYMTNTNAYTIYWGASASLNDYLAQAGCAPTSDQFSAALPGLKDYAQATIIDFWRVRSRGKLESAVLPVGAEVSVEVNVCNGTGVTPKVICGGFRYKAKGARLTYITADPLGREARNEMHSEFQDGAITWVNDTFCFRNAGATGKYTITLKNNTARGVALDASFGEVFSNYNNSPFQELGGW